MIDELDRVTHNGEKDITSALMGEDKYGLALPRELSVDFNSMPSPCHLPFINHSSKVAFCGECRPLPPIPLIRGKPKIRVWMVQMIAPGQISNQKISLSGQIPYLPYLE